jgi:hypothetical protein
VLDAQVESLAAALDGLHVLAGGSFTRSNRVAQKSPGQGHGREWRRLYIGGTVNTANGVAHSVPAGPTTVVTTGYGTSRSLPVLNLPTDPPAPGPHHPGAGRTHSGILRPIRPCSSRDRAAVS